MRLIDADEVKKYIHDLMLNNSDRYTDKEMTQYDSLIDSCRIVEAIPIEWIEKWGYQNGMSESMSLAVMIDDWRLEHESRIGVRDAEEL